MDSNIYEHLFTLPIDLENEDENFTSSHKISINFEEEKKYNEINMINDNICINQVMELLDGFSNNNVNKKNGNNNLEESKFIVFSNEKNNKNIKSLINSSRIYISEILEKNWKLKIKKIIRKMKLQYIEKLNSIENENIIKNNSFNNIDSFINNYSNNTFIFNQNNKNNDNQFFSENIKEMNNLQEKYSRNFSISYSK